MAGQLQFPGAGVRQLLSLYGHLARWLAGTRLPIVEIFHSTELELCNPLAPNSLFAFQSFAFQSAIFLSRKRVFRTMKDPLRNTPSNPERDEAAGPALGGGSTRPAA
jgi:hypothetical protein